ncbi:MAG: serine/threonine protein kinase [Myxococcales bacterium]|nr:MAG: serine/threonine protein kinase [Myxococcales bacterium]
MPSTNEDHGGELTPGLMLGRYELLMPLAKGGMGSVWAARLKGTRGFRKLVAVKTILRNMENAQLQQMLYQEAVVASQIRHPNVAETLELGEHEGRMYLVMELVLGESLLFVLREAQPDTVPFDVSVNLVAQVCRGLAAAHDLRDENGQCIGLVHRDVSPTNVLVTESGIVKIVDFGVATTASNATYGSGEIKGKISYLAPEQLRGEPLDARVDVFATGILLYSLTVGRHPFRCASESSTISRILSTEPAAPPSALVENYPEAVEQVVLRALDKNRETRYPSMLALLEALETACPAAFGPRADEAVARYIQGLLKERLRERASTLRVAEDWAETSSRHSRASLPAVATSTPPQAKPARAALIGVGGVLTGLAMAAALVVAYLNGPASPVRAAAANVPRQQARLAMLDQRGTLEEEPPAASADAPEAALSASQASREPRTASATSRKEEAEARAERGAAEASAAASVLPPAVEESPETPVAAAALPEVKLPAPEPSPRAMAPTATPLAPPSPNSVAPTGPRSISSKLAHRQLLTNPSSEAARIQVPELLRRTQQRFGATVNLCVDAGGRVTQVSIVRSAGPALDPQITRALSNWRYRPLMEDGKATPFCYVLNYQLDAR